MMIKELSENDYSEWSVKASEFMFQLMKDFPKGFTADEFYQRSRQVKMPAAIIKRLAGKEICFCPAIRCMERRILAALIPAAGCIRSTSTAALSPRCIVSRIQSTTAPEL